MVCVPFLLFLSLVLVFCLGEGWIYVKTEKKREENTNWL